MIPGLVVGAPQSGAGKTTVVCAVAAALRRRGLDLRPYKAGPDYLDPLWHRVAAGRPARNLDGWMTGRDGVQASFARGARGGDLALIEGVMGLYDGASPDSLSGSAAELALVLGLPVVLVVDASAMARTAAAVVAGLAGHVPELAVVGVIFNRVGSAGHARLLQQAMAHVPQVQFLGALPQTPEAAIPERHLGLVTPEAALPPGWAERLAALAEAHLDLDALLGLARVAQVADPGAARAGEGTVRIGVARDEAFHFTYEENLDLLAEAGAALVPFSPLHDTALPPDLDGLYLCGGYPEVHAAALAANTGMRAALRDFPGVIYAECGGMMLLGRDIDGHPMVGRLPLSTRLTGRLVGFGYREVRARIDTPLGPAGTAWRGHAFHHAALVGEVDSPAGLSATGWGGEEQDGWGDARVFGTWIHAHFGSNPALARHLVAACRAAAANKALRPGPHPP